MTFLLYPILRSFHHAATVGLLIVFLAGCAGAPPIPSPPLGTAKLRIGKAADLPRFSYPVQGDLAGLVRDDARFMPLAQKMAQDFSGVLLQYDIAETASQRQYLSLLAQIALLDGRFEETLRLTAQIKSLQDKPADKLLSGLVNARIEFGHTLRPDPCPTRELQERAARNFGVYVDFIRKQGVRVVNMSWSGNARGYESTLEQCGLGADAVERKTMAREFFQLHWDALRNAMASAPDIIFVASAGNSGNDPSFNEAYPSSIVLANLITVGAVDKAGDEAAFTSYGPTVAVHANGYQVDSDVPGGKRLALSGTSMSAPQVTNLAAKMLAVNPGLSAVEVIAIIKRTAEKTRDGRRTLIHPANALAAAGYRP